MEHERLLFGTLHLNEVKGDITDRKLITCPKIRLTLNPLAIEQDTVHAAQIPDDPSVVYLGNTTVPSGDLLTTNQTDITLRMATKEDYRLIKRNLGPSPNRHES